MVAVTLLMPLLAATVGIDGGPIFQLIATEDLDRRALNLRPRWSALRRVRGSICAKSGPLDAAPPNDTEACRKSSRLGSGEPGILGRGATWLPRWASSRGHPPVCWWLPGSPVYCTQETFGLKSAKAPSGLSRHAQTCSS